MFTCPVLEQGRQFPELPVTDPRWQQLLHAADVVVDPYSSEDMLLQLTRYAIGFVEKHPDYVKSWHNETVRDSPRAPVFREAGFTDTIYPLQKEQHTTAVDGGNMSRYTRRISHVDAMEKSGLLETENLVVFGGQALRNEVVDDFSGLAALARMVAPRADRLTRAWMRDELAKDPSHPDVWKRPFATERELGRLGLAFRHGKRLRYQGTLLRPGAQAIHESIPAANEAADLFSLDGKRVLLLNAPAKYREHAGRINPDLSEARPTGRSCFHEYLTLESPPPGASILLATSAPNIYRSWCDMLLRAAESGRADLNITATGMAINRNRRMSHVLTAFGDLIVNHYNYAYEGGVDSPQREPFKI
ncbi:MAG TPA: hypothetical protein VLF62_00575 [Candidatus Saccharimonadales bacterium]|nr:hypothetical protein [Candidatus Saccharimonadales bacterium]